MTNPWRPLALAAALNVVVPEAIVRSMSCTPTDRPYSLVRATASIA